CVKFPTGGYSTWFHW
nr:immunoglobulin heavy chain junction region [Macaca mulatta]MOW23297.1 immunoglobulin heavy chain junction region [Macaca mulatta]MOW23377.1 immunoglobulin heavy chain junction region [Macaca mulatta]MOW23382.1 immunoglobulin heavy chain junction region [Macaca mulatta]MOW23397.1 immunoglobulin heavy chain junction region [Macaca mulatta]